MSENESSRREGFSVKMQITIFGGDQFIFFSFFKKTDFIFDFLIKLSFGLFFSNLTMSIRSIGAVYKSENCFLQDEFFIGQNPTRI